MPDRIQFPEWIESNEATSFPFAEHATLTNKAGDVLLAGTFLDAVIAPIGGTDQLYLSQVILDHQNVTLWIGDASGPLLASGSFSLIQPPNLVDLFDPYGRPAGLLVSESIRLAVFQSWSVGTHTFAIANTPFAATVCCPTPDTAVRGIELDDGTVLTGDVWLIGEHGIVLSHDVTHMPNPCGGSAGFPTIRVDAVGDPLFRRKLCQPSGLFSTPNFVSQLRIVAPNTTFTVTPDELGNIRFTANNADAVDTVLRIRTTPQGLTIEAVGSVSNG